MNMNQTEEVDFDILDSTVDELADLKEFLPFPAGTYICLYEAELKAIQNKPAVISKFKLREVVELANAQHTEPAADATTDVAFILKNNDGGVNEVAQGKLKLVVTALKETFGGDTVRETLQNAKGAEVKVTFKVRTDRNDKDKHYNDIVALEVV